MRASLQCIHAIRILAICLDLGPVRGMKIAVDALGWSPLRLAWHPVGLMYVEAAAAASLSMSQQGAIEREATIRSLQEEVARYEGDMSREVWTARYDLEAENSLLVCELRATERVLATDVRRAEHLVAVRDDLIAEIRQENDFKEANRSLTKAEERQQLVEHLQSVAVRRIVKMDLARGWSSWAAQYRYYQTLKRRAGSRFRNGALHAAIKRWVHTFPPKGSVRRAVEPLEEQIKDLDRALSAVREAHKKTKERAERAEQKVREAGGELEEEREKRVAHLMHIAVNRIGQLELARGWTTWVFVVMRTRQMRQIALKRFQNHTLYKGFNAWRLKHPPINSGANLERELQRERKAHERTKATLHERTTERDLAREHARETARLQLIVRELQRVLAEAMMASSWVGCRQILYHESLRYVSSAATHGKMLPKAVKKEILRGGPEKVSGRQLSGRMIAHALEDGQVRRSDEAEAWAASAGADQLADMQDAGARASTQTAGTPVDMMAEPDSASVASIKQMLADSEHTAQIRQAQQAAEEARANARAEMEAMKDDEVAVAMAARTLGRASSLSTPL
mmetsp:Transcript_30869/g.80555  ORF Transcript_30869/g.80555 Transcript_30869/m.80555 type:complete len:570 (-) Transcript_30869:376-2085(-)